MLSFNLVSVLALSAYLFGQVSALPQASVSASASASKTSSTTSASATPTYGAYAKNNNLGQMLVNKLLADHADLAIVGIHATPPGGKSPDDEQVVAINLDRIGKPDDSDDIAVATEGKTIMAPNLSDPTKFEIAVPLFNVSMQPLVASLNLVFKYKAGDDQIAIHQKAFAYRAEIAPFVTTTAALFAKVGTVGCNSTKA